MRWYVRASTIPAPQANSVKRYNSQILSQEMQLSELNRSTSIFMNLIHSYESYIKIVERVLEGPKPHQIDAFGYSHKHAPACPKNELAKPQAHGITLSGATRDRLERLRCDLTYDFLAEIQHCLQEQEVLLVTTVSRYLLRCLGRVLLMPLYQSRTHLLKRADSWNDLTRLMVLLIDILVLILPLKLMSAYFGLNGAAQRGYTTTVYWITFGITVCISLIAVVAVQRGTRVHERKTSIN